MKKFLHKSLLLTIVAVMAMSLSSCDERFWRDDVLGTWGLIAYSDEYNEYSVGYHDYMYEEYVFYEDGSGFYTSNSGVRTQFYWDEYSSRHLVLKHSDGMVEDFYYRYDRGDLVMSHDPSFVYYYVYERIRY